MSTSLSAYNFICIVYDSGGTRPQQTTSVKRKQRDTQFCSRFIHFYYREKKI
jgi:hypothetical protein